MRTKGDEDFWDVLLKLDVFSDELTMVIRCKSQQRSYVQVRTLVNHERAYKV